MRFKNICLAMVLFLMLAMTAVTAAYLPYFYRIGTGQDEELSIVRNTAAYRPDGTTVEANEYITKDFLVYAKGGELATDDTGGTSLFNEAETTNYIWGHQVGALYKKSKTSGDWAVVSGAGIVNYTYSNGANWLIVFNSLETTGKYSVDEGATWTAITTMPVITTGGGALSGPRGAITFSSNTAMMCEYDVSDPPAVDGRKIWKSVDYGANWTTCLDIGDLTAPNLVGTTTGEVAGMTLSEALHFHCVCYHAATGTWIAGMGDGTSNRRLWQSTDNGTSWTSVLRGDCLQPMIFTDYGDPTKLLAGGDDAGACYYYDISTTYATNRLIDRMYISSGGNYIWQVLYSGGYYWAFENSVSAYNQIYDAKVFISTDTVNWATYWQLPTNYKGINFVSGVAQGYLHATALLSDASYQNIKIPIPASTTTRTFIRVDPDITNYMNTANKSNFATDVSEALLGTGTNQQITSDETTFWTGAKSCRYSKTTPGTAGYGGVRLAAGHSGCTELSGRAFYSRVWICGQTGGSPVYFCTQSSSVGTGGATYFMVRNPNEWVEILSGANTAPPNGTADTYAGWRFLVGAVDVQTTADYDFYVGGVCTSNQSSAFQIGGTPRAATNIAYTTTQPATTATDGWTSFLTIIPDVGCYHSEKFYYTHPGTAIIAQTDDTVFYHGAAGAGLGIVAKAASAVTTEIPPDSPWTTLATITTANVASMPYYHVKTWDAGDGNKLVLVLDATPRYTYSAPTYTEIAGLRFKLLVYLAGTLTYELVQPADVWWDRRSQIEFAVSVGPTLYFWVRTPYSGSACQEASQGGFTSSAADFLGKPIVHRYGSSVGLKSLSEYVLYSGDKWFTTAMTNAAGAISEEMNEIALNDPVTETDVGLYGKKQHLFGE